MSSLENKNNSCVIIPFFNEKQTLDEVCRRVFEYVDFIILVDDGSNDGYNLPSLPAEKHVLLKHEVNKGKGAALKSGFIYACKHNFKKVITLDADLQHLPEQIPEFLDKLTEGKIVIGSRMSNISGMPLQRKMSNFITTLLVKLKTGINIGDSQSGYRGYSGEYLQYYQNISDNWGAETEILVISVKNGAIFEFVSIPTIYTEISTSKMQPLRAIIQFLRAIIKTY